MKKLALKNSKYYKIFFRFGFFGISKLSKMLVIFERNARIIIRKRHTTKRKNLCDEKIHRFNTVYINVRFQ